MAGGEGKPLSRLAVAAGGKLVSPISADVRIFDVCHDSRQAAPGMLFVAIAGSAVDGHDFAERASQAGASAICVERHLDLAVPQIVVSDSRAVLGPLSAEVHDHPSRTLSVIGVTGTNGKTTVTHYLESIALDAGLSTGLIGTIATRIGRTTIASTRTTPEASDFQRLLGQMRDAGVDLVAAEVSSHALDLGRVAATRFAVAAFTNLSQDHLDFHGDMDAYGQAKRRLFTEYEVGKAVINIDDTAGRSIASDYRGDLLTVGRDGEVRSSELRAVDTGTSFKLDTPYGSAQVVSPVVGSFNVDNAVLAAACALASDLRFGDVVDGLHSLAGVPGRFEIVSGDDPIRVVVDYAHTPEGVELALQAAGTMTPRRVIAMIGAGGDRDREKRPLMGSAASAADLAIVTSDNPRSEDPDSIVAAVAAGLDPETDAIIESDREAAIGRAVDEAEDGDVVLVLGRGHEPTQEIAGRQVPFDDREVARRALNARRSREGKSAETRTDSGRMAR